MATKTLSVFKRIGVWLLAIGPGIFAIGYTIGTGSVTSMSKAGADYGTQLLWTLALSCIFSGVLLEAFGRYAIVTGDTAIHSIRTKLGLSTGLNKAVAVITIVGVVIAQWTALSGILGLTSHAVWETVRLFIPSLPTEHYWAILGIAAILIFIMYGFLMVGKYGFFEKILVFFVSMMGLAFIISMFIVMPDPAEVASGFIPRIPPEKSGRLLVAAMVGTTMAAPTFITRPLLMQGKKWTKDNIWEQRRDAIVAMVLMFVVSGSIIVTATGALHHHGLSIDKVMDMVVTLEPIAGKFAVALFMVGVMSAGLSSTFPILMVLPWLIADYRDGELDTDSKRFKILCAVAAVVGLAVPILGGNPIIAQIVTQVFGIFILPVIILCIIYLINQEKYMGPLKAGRWLNVGLWLAFVFACISSYTGVLAFIDMIRGVI